MLIPRKIYFSVCDLSIPKLINWDFGFVHVCLLVCSFVECVCVGVGVCVEVGV